MSSLAHKVEKIIPAFGAALAMPFDSGKEHCLSIAPASRRSHFSGILHITTDMTISGHPPVTLEVVFSIDKFGPVTSSCALCQDASLRNIEEKTTGFKQLRALLKYVGRNNNGTRAIALICAHSLPSALVALEEMLATRAPGAKRHSGIYIERYNDFRTPATLIDEVKQIVHAEPDSASAEDILAALEMRFSLLNETLSHSINN